MKIKITGDFAWTQVEILPTLCVIVDVKDDDRKIVFVIGWLFWRCLINISWEPSVI